MRNWWILAAIVVVIMAVPAHADDATAQAKKAFQAATAAFDAKKYDDALADYEEAYRIKPLPGFLFNIGLCHRKLGHHEIAATFFERYLNAEPKAKNKADVQAMLDEERKLAANSSATDVKPSTVAKAPAPPTSTPRPPTSTSTATVAVTAPATTTAPQALQPETHDAPTASAAPASEAEGDATPWIVGGGVGVGVVVAAVATTVVIVVATGKPAPIGTIDLRGATP